MNSHEHETPLHICTPLQYSKVFSKLLPDTPAVYMKMENCQPSGSFKIRGVGRLAQKSKERGCQRIIVSSGGNAGIAASHAAQALNIPCTVYMPQTAPPAARRLIKSNGAEIKIGGAVYDAAEKIAREEAKKPGVAYISPYDDPEVWEGHVSMIDELKEQLPSKPSAVVCSVGGGGLLIGVLHGLQKHGWEDVPVIAMETYGANCFSLSLKAKKIVALEEITSIATCLGARTVAQHLWDIVPNFNIISEVITDAQAAESCIRFADDEHVLVEPGCGATLAAVYCGVIEKLQNEGRLPALTTGPVVIIVCGGNGVSLSRLQEWSRRFNINIPE
ncbi:L-serine dehydratase/L-threonine deaminase-like [Periplaneta americana]|uniref:L-serine ammonia-lyase n=1 Tax=Periplaneta americana TaxID=6978 RepID=A0ABQ8STJ3_PERAM|nr:hypothetical protein ANN_16902 [Periplaneta americana]